MDSREPIAIIGIACRFPGDASSPKALWTLLSAGTDAITEIPPDRWNVTEYYHPVPGTPGKTYSRWGGFLRDIGGFEPEAFGISPREAAYMDPQQRLLLEVAWEALEDGGQVVERLSGTHTGVFVGISTSDYAQIQATPYENVQVDAHAATGGALSIAAGRISYCLNLRGPSFAVDTACSSSLVATHLACQSLWNGESDLALAGGVNAIISPGPFLAFCAASMLSPVGRCKAFDASADGFVRSEGAGMVLLKPLSRALADRDPIYAVILGSAVNQDGRTAGISAPSQSAQEALLREACRRAGIAPHQVYYVEAHGTGTAVGDPIEAGAIGNVLSAGRGPGRPSVIGSVKTNIGHLEAASGIAGLIKATLAVHHRTIPANLHFDTPNPGIPFETLRMRVPTVSEPWPDDARPATAGVNSFGFGGTNAHVVIQEYDSRQALDAVPAPVEPLAAELLPLSARSPESLQALAASYRDVLRGDAAMSVSDLCYTAGVRRTHLEHRLSLVGRTRESFADQLDAFLAGETRPGMSGGRRRQPAPRLIGVFSGQGPQWWAMGRQLLEAEPVFRRAIEECDALLPRGASWSLVGELTADEDTSRLHETSIAQPAIFALQVALTALWTSWGVRFDAVVGHSVGEIAAAHVAGALDLETAVRVIYHRGRCMDLASSKGRMLAVGLPWREVSRAVHPHEAVVSVAAMNSPISTTLSGDPDALEAIAHSLEGQGVFCRFLPVNYAFHSQQMDPIRDELLTALASVPSRAPDLTFVSTVTGAASPQLDADYWWQNVRQPVRFGPAVERLIDQGFDAFIEIGPHPVLSGAVSQCLAHRGRPGYVLSSLRRQEDEQATMLASLGTLYTLGYPVDWRLRWPEGGRCLRLPPYPWQRQRYWHESETVRGMRLESHGHPLLGRARSSADPSWEMPADPKVLRYLGDHRVQGQAVFPAAAYVEQALAVARERLGTDQCVLEDLEFPKALFLPEDEAPATVQTVFYAKESSFAVYSQTVASRTPWTLHATGTMRTIDAAPERPGDPEQLRQTLPEEIDADSCYALMAASGLDFGPSFKGLERLWRRDGEALGRIGLRDELVAEHGAYQFHPAFLDSCFHVIVGAVPRRHTASGLRLYMPDRIERVRLHREVPPRVWSHVSLRHASATVLLADIRVLDDVGRLVLEVTGFRCQAVEGASDASGEVERSLWNVTWYSRPLPDDQAATRPAGDLPAPRAIAEGEIGELIVTRDWSGMMSRVLGPLEEVSIAYIVRALDELGWEATEGTLIASEALVERLGIIPRHRPLVRRFLQILEREEYLRQVGVDTWEVSRALPREDVSALWRQSLSRHPSGIAELTLIAACGSRLPAILRGEADPLDALFPDGSTTAAEHVFQDSPSCVATNVIVQRVVRRLVRALPTDRALRLIEVGAGTGALTSYVLPELPGHRTEYLFTDVSAFFLTKAEPTLRDHPFVRCEMLDIERDPVEQGYAPHGFDLILAANVLHATRDLRESLRHLESLLTAEGLLVLVEGENLPAWTDLTFGTTAGWWRFTDVDLRPDHALLARDSWQTLLEERGWTDVWSVAVPLESRKTGGPFVLFARGPSLPSADVTAASTTPAAEPGSWMIFADQSGVGDGLARALEADGDTCWLVTPGDAFQCQEGARAEVSPERPEDMERLLERVTAPGSAPLRGAIHLWSLDAAPAAATTTESLQRAEALGCHSVMHLVQALHRQGTVPDGVQLLLVTRGAQSVGERPLAIAQTPLVGVGRTLVHEYPDLRCKLVDLDPDPAAGEHVALVAELRTEDPNEEVVLRRGARFVPRVERMNADAVPIASTLATATPYRLEPPATGVLSSLTFRTTSRPRPGTGQVEIEVAAAALNFRDVLKALRLFPGDADDSMVLGDECAGIVVEVGEGVDTVQVGDEVVAIAPACLGSHVITAASLVVRKPAHLTFAEAVTMPVAFVTAIYGLHHVARIAAGERVLIHAAAGGVGLAAVQVAQLAGADVWATAGSREKRALLTRLGVRHVLDSRSLAFYDQIMDETDGKGVDIVLNSLAGPALTRSLACLGPGGRFVELGKRDIYANNKIGLFPFRKNVAFFGVDLTPLITTRPDLMRAMLGDVLRSVEDRKVHPLPHRVFPATRVVEAFRYMAQARHVGKVVVSMLGENVLPAPGAAEPVEFRPDATYLVTGGLSGFGLTVAQWIVEHGCRHLLLIGRSGGASDEARDAVAALRNAGARVEIAAADVASVERMTAVLAEMRRTMPPLRGVFHAAMALDDALLLSLDAQRFRKATAAKTDGTWNLHTQTLDCPLDHFVLFSSVATLAGPPGQAAYVAGNVFEEAIAVHRRSLGLPGLAISWGSLSEVGYVARHQEVADYLKRLGVTGLTPREATGVLARLMSSGAVHVGVARVDWRRWADGIGGRRLAQRLSSVVSGDGGRATGGQTGALRELVRHAAPEERETIVRDYVREQAARVLGASAASLDIQRPLPELGLDSLMAIDLKNRLESELALALPIRELMQAPTVEKLSQALLRLLDAAGGARPDRPDAASTAVPAAGTALPGLIPLRSGPAAPALFCFHPAGGQVSVYKPLVDLLPQGLTAYAIPSRIVTGAATELESIDEMAGAYAATIRERQPRGPYHLFGFSFGGFVAMAVAAVLEAQGETVAFVGLVDCDLRWTEPSYERERMLQTMIASTYSLLQQETGILKAVAGDELVELAGSILSSSPEERVDAAVGWLSERRHVREDIPPAMVRDYLSIQIARIESHLQLIPGFRPTPIRAPLSVWRARDGSSAHDAEARSWAMYSYAGAVEATIAGTHYGVMVEPHVSELGRQVTDRLRAVHMTSA